MDREEILSELSNLRTRVQQLETQLNEDDSSIEEKSWRTQGYYTAYYATAGFLLGIIPAAVSLLGNVIGSVLFKGDQHPLHLIRVFLTFPMGAKALEINSGLTLTIGCFLYLITGMFYGMIFQLLFTRFFATSSVVQRVIVGVLFGCLLWFINFKLILTWLQPTLFGGNWIVTEIPSWVALLTHILFGATMALVSPLGSFVPYHKVVEDAE